MKPYGTCALSLSAFALGIAFAQDLPKTFSAESKEVIKDGIRSRRARDRADLTTMRIEIEVDSGFAYRSRKRGPEEHHVIATDEPFTRGGQDTAPSPLGLFATSLGTCVLNQFNRLTVVSDLDLAFTKSSLEAVFSGEAGGDFKSFTQEVFAVGEVSSDEIEELVNQVDSYCRISVTLRRVVPITTILRVNGVEVSRKEFLPSAG